MASNDFYDPNQNKYHKLDGNVSTASQSISSSATNITHQTANNSLSQMYSNHHHQSQMNDRYNTRHAHMNGTNNNNNNINNGHMNGLSSAVLHPALLNIMNETQGMKFRGNITLTLIKYTQKPFPFFQLNFY